MDIELFEGPDDFVLGNYIGTDATGTRALANAAGLGVDASTSSVFVGGPAAGAGNLIAANKGTGIGVGFGPVAILGNLIGTDASGSLPLGNSGQGIRSDANDTTIGGTAAGAGNLIRFSGLDGVQLQGDRDLVQGNLITDSGIGNALPRGRAGR